jgi:hypothetical protein
MRENRLYGSEGGAAKAVPTPIGTTLALRLCDDGEGIARSGFRH